VTSEEPATDPPVTTVTEGVVVVHSVRASETTGHIDDGLSPGPS
jgi:hypothetical protein